MTRPRRLTTIAGVAMVAGLIAGCAGKALKQARVADELREHDVAVAEYTKALREDPDNREARLGLDRARLRASDAHLLRGRRLFSQGAFDEALMELQLSYELNPTNGDAERELQAVRLALRAKLSAPVDGRTALESVLARARSLTALGHELPDVTLPAQIATGSQMTSRLLYMTIAQMGGISVIYDQQFRDTPAPAVLLNNMTLRGALDAAARATSTFYQVTSPGTITVAPDTPAKRREYVEEVIAVIPIQNADLKEVMDTFRVVADLRSISIDTGLKAISVRDTPERVAAAQKLAAALDKARPEIVVNVEVLEIDRTRLREYGMQIASAGSTGIEGALVVDPADALTLRSIRSLTAADVLTTNIPALYYRLLKTDTRTRTLANPHLRIIDGIQARANFGEEVAVARTVIVPITQGGVNIQPQTTYEYRNVGVNLAITPRIHPSDEVTLGLDIELSSLAGVGLDGLPSFGTRSVETTIRLRDGQTNILAGLIREDDRVSKESLPGLGDVPILGTLFARNRREATQTDVVIMLTPHIVRSLDLTEDDLRPFRIPREGSGIDGGPIVPPPPPIRGGGPGGAAGSRP